MTKLDIDHISIKTPPNICKYKKNMLLSVFVDVIIL